MVIIFMHGVRTSIRPKNKKRATTDTMQEDNDQLLPVAWWVILYTPDLLLII